jgi:hypothetical protein
MEEEFVLQSQLQIQEESEEQEQDSDSDTTSPIINITDKLRIRVDSLCWTVQELTGGEGKETWDGDNKYYVSWYALLNYLFKKAVKEKMSKKKEMQLKEANELYCDTIKEVAQLLFKKDVIPQVEGVGNGSKHGSKKKGKKLDTVAKKEVKA